MREFAGKSLSKLFEVESSDGDLGLIDALFSQAADIGLISFADSKTQGYELGVWGTLSMAEEWQLSAEMLSIIGEVCAGFASIVHAQGIGCFPLGGKKETGFKRNSLACMIDSGYPLSQMVPLDNREEYPLKPCISRTTQGHFLSGRSLFVLSSPSVEGLTVFAFLDGETNLLYFPIDKEGIQVVDSGPRVGLRAARIIHVTFTNVSIANEDFIMRGDEATNLLKKTTAINWYGLSAISLGIARSAYRKALTYTEERYQGGNYIRNHPAITHLLVEAGTDIWLVEQLLMGMPKPSESPDELLLYAAKMKLFSSQATFRAVTNSLQVFGGYGYTEDYGLEKRLRDLATIKSLHGSPIFLKSFIANLSIGKDVI